ncbi:MAG: BRO family protein [Rickettsiales bacterium]
MLLLPPATTLVITSLFGGVYQRQTREAIMTKSITFHNNQISVTKLNGSDWVRGIEIFYSLGCKFPKQSLASFCYTHGEELQELGAIKRLKVKTGGGQQECIMLNRHGAWVAGMVSRTPLAKEFRKWVLDVLEEQTNKEPQDKLIEQRNQPAIPSDTQRDLGMLYAMLMNCGENLREATHYSQQLPFSEDAFHLQQHLSRMNGLYPEMVSFSRMITNRLLPEGTPKLRKTVTYCL